MTTCYHYTTRYAIGGILHDREISKARYPKDTPIDFMYNWFTSSRSLEIGAAYGALFEPPGATLTERIRVFGNTLRDRDFTFQKRLELIDEVIASEPIRVGVDVESIPWDLVQARELPVWYGTLQPVGISKWISFEQLHYGRRDKWTNEVYGKWIGWI